MKKVIYLFSCIVLFSCNNKPLDLNVMTFNVRYDNPGDSLNSWSYRKDVAADVIKINDVDLLGTQEVLANQMHDLKQSLPAYQTIGVGRADGKTEGEFSAIFYKKDRFTEEKSGWFWLSETPEIAGSKGWDGACERVATWAILKEIETGKRVFFINTHLDHVGEIARKKGVELLLERAKAEGKGLPIIITGDFNATPESEVIAHIVENGEFHDSRLIAQEVKATFGTFHAFGRIPMEDRQIIDHIFVSEPISVLSYEVLPDDLNGVLVSDHNPVLAKVTVK